MSDYSWNWSFGSEGSTEHRGGMVISSDDVTTDSGDPIVTEALDNITTG